MVASDAVLESNVASSSLRDRPYNETLASVTVSASSLPNIGDDDPVMIDISCFTTAKILDKRSSPCGVEYRCELEPLWVACRLGERGANGMHSCSELRERTGTSSSSRHVKERNTKEEAFTDVSMLSR